MRKLIKIFLFPLFLLILLFIFIKSGFVAERIRNTIIRRFDDNVEIGSIEGNLLTNIILRDVKYGDIFNAATISLSYTPLSLARKKIKSVDMYSPSFCLTKGGNRGGKFSFPFDILSFQLTDGSIIKMPGVSDVRVLSLKGSLIKKATDQVFKIHTGKGNFEFQSMPINIQQIGAEVSINDTLILIRDLTCSTDSSRFSILGCYIGDSLALSISISASLQEFIPDAKGQVTSGFRMTKAKDTLLIKGWVRLIEGEYRKREIGNADVYMTLLNKQLKLRIREWRLGESVIQGMASVNLTPPFSYNIMVSGNKLDLAYLYSDLPTNLQGKIEITGEGANFSSNLHLSGLMRGTDFDSLYAQILYRNGSLEIPFCKAIQGLGTFSVTGRIDTKDLELHLLGEKLDLTTFFPRISGTSNFDLIIRGNPRNPDVLGTFYVKDLKFGELESEYFSGNLKLTNLIPLEGEGEFTLANFILYKNKFETLKAVLSSSEGYTDYDIVSYDDVRKFKLKGRGKGGIFAIDTLLFHTPVIHLLNSGRLVFDIDQRGVSIEKCVFLLNDSLIVVNGYISKDRVNISTSIQNLDLHSFSDSLTGIVNAHLMVKGAIGNPEISLHSKTRNFSYKSIQVKDIVFSCLYQDQLLHIEECQLINEREQLQILGDIPMTFPFQLRDRPLDLTVNMSNFGGEIFFPYRRFAELDKCRIDANLKVSGTPKQPEFWGDVSLKAKTMLVRFLGTTLEKVAAVLHFKKDTINIVSLTGETEEGFLEITGYLQPQGMLSISIQANKLPIHSIEDVDALVTVDLVIEGDINNPTISGIVEVDKAVIAIPFEKPKAVNIRYPIDYDLIIDFPHNVWIKNPQADASLEGKVIARKTGRDFFLSGETRIKEGYYYYAPELVKLEVPFKIEKGEFQFTNSPELNPKIDVLASTVVEYTITETVNGERLLIDTSCIVNLNITGTLREPDFMLSSEPPKPMQDILSLLSLNMTWDELTRLESLEYSKIGDKYMSYYIRTKILGDIKSQIGLDALRLETELLGKEKKARFNVGKYISEDLYVSYTHNIFSTSKYEFKAEYSPWKYGSLIGERTEEGQFRAGIGLKFRY